MSELKLTQHPEITELLSVLEQNGLHKEQDEVQILAAYIDEMEGQLSAMNLERQAASAQITAERLGGIQSELQEAGAHIQRAGRTLLGRPEPEDAEYEQNRGLLGKAQTVIGRMRNSLSSMAARTAQLVDRLTSERETPDSRHSVKEALRDLQAEKKYGEDFPAPAEPIR